MKLAKDGKSVTLGMDELEAIVQQLQQAEKLVEQLEKHEGAGGKLPAEVQGAWTAWKSFTEAQDARHQAASGTPTPRARKTYCCQLSSELGVLKCETFHNRTYAFAWAACVGQALLARVNATLSEGDCNTKPGCLQAKGV